MLIDTNRLRGTATYLHRPVLTDPTRGRNWRTVPVTGYLGYSFAFFGG